MKTGAYYSRAGESFYALKTHSAQRAFDLLGLVNTKEPRDGFTDYALGLVNFEFGKAALENGQKNFLDCFGSTAKLFEAVPAVEKRFVQEMMQYEGPHLFEYETLQGFLHRLRPSEPVSEAFSFFMGKAAVARFNMKKIKFKQFRVILGKALAIDPGNEFVIRLKEQAAIEQETEALCNAMSRRKMGKATALAVKTRFPEVRDRFYDFAGQMIEQIEEEGSQNPFRIKEIVRAAAFEMRQRRHSAKTIALAQKKLLDPVSRTCQEFLYWVDFETAKERIGRELDEIMDAFEAIEENLELKKDNLDKSARMLGKNIRSIHRKLSRHLKSQGISQITFQDDKAVMEQCKVLETRTDPGRENGALLEIVRNGYRNTRDGAILRKAEVITVRNDIKQ